MDLYLETLPEAVISNVFTNPQSCLVILRLLPPLARAIVMRLLYAPSSTQLSVLTAFLGSLNTVKAHQALYKLKSMKIVKEKFVSQSLDLNSTYKENLRKALGSASSTQYQPVPSQYNLAPDFLQQVFVEKWEAMLMYVVSAADPYSDAKQPPKITQLLKNARLLSRSNSVTADGFQFLLQNRHSQVWQLLLHLLNNSQDLAADLIDLLTFLFSLAATKVGSPQKLQNLSQSQQLVVQELTGLGLVYTTDDFYYATTDLSQSTATSTANSGFLIAETNYRIYAYTDSPLQISILGLFCNIKARFANLVICRLTRTSCRRALKSGISSDQIIEYLRSNHRSTFPPTIQDQVKLWQLEMDRFRQADGVLFKDFHSSTEYSNTAKYAEDIGALLWRSDKRRIFFVSERSASSIAQQLSSNNK